LASTHLNKNIDDPALTIIFQSAIQYCIDFIEGEKSNALGARNKRNLKLSQDPLGLDSDNSHLNKVLGSRNEELKVFYREYI